MNKMRVSLTQRADEIRGTIELCKDGVFVLEGLAMVVAPWCGHYTATPEALQIIRQRIAEKIALKPH